MKWPVFYLLKGDKVKNIRKMVEASNARKAKAITGAPLKQSAHAKKAMSNGGAVKIMVGPAPAGMPMKRKCGGRT
jgi:hypothetical protein